MTHPSRPFHEVFFACGLEVVRESATFDRRLRGEGGHKAEQLRKRLPEVAKLVKVGEDCFTRSDEHVHQLCR
jgi:hypothetical protein